MLVGDFDFGIVGMVWVFEMEGKSWLVCELVEFGE